MTTSKAQEVDAFGSADLCKACGLCCRGVWFQKTCLEPDELEQAMAHGFELVPEQDGPAAFQPCPQFKNGCCASYDSWRPATCHEYRCRLLQEFEGGQVVASVALGHVKAASVMAERIFAEVGHIPGGIRGKDFLQRLDAEAPLQRLSDVARMDALALHVYYMRHFCDEDAN
jgi:uncharacterized protein